MGACISADARPTEQTFLVKGSEDDVAIVSLNQWVLCIFIFILFFVDASYMTSTAPFLPDWVESRGLDSAWIGAFVGGQTGAMLIGMTAGMYVVKLIGNANSILLGVFLSAVMCLGAALVPPLLTGTAMGVAILMFRSIAGLGDGLLQLAALSTVIRILPEKDLPFVTGASEGLRALGGVAGPFLGGWLFQVGGYRAAMAVPSIGFLFCFVGILLLISSVPATQKMVKGKDEASVRIFLSKPPLFALMIYMFLLTIPFSLYEPSIEPHLTAPPFDLTPGHVGNVFGVTAFADVIGAVSAGFVSKIVGQMPIILFCPLSMMSAIAFLIYGPQTIVCFSVALVWISFALYPAFVVCSQLMMRVLRSYEIDPKDYSEIIAAVVMGAMTSALSLGGLSGGFLLANLGFNNTWLFALCIVIPAPILIVICFHPAVMGRPLAKLADVSTERQLQSERRMADENSKNSTPNNGKRDASQSLRSA